MPALTTASSSPSTKLRLRAHRLAQNAMQDRFISEVERLSGRQVMHFVSNSHLGPDIEIDRVFLAPPSEG